MVQVNSYQDLVHDLRMSRPQRLFRDSKKPHNLICGGWRSGKTWIGAFKAIKKSIDHFNSVGLIAANSYKQLHHSTLPVYWKMLMEFYEISKYSPRGNPGGRYVFNTMPPAAWNVKRRFQNHDAVITFKWGAQVFTRSLKNYEDIEGIELGWAWIDEAWDTKREAFDTVLSRLSCPNMKPCPTIDVTTRPDGFNWLYDYFHAEPEKNDKLKETRWSTQLTSYHNEANLADGYIDSQLENLDPQLAEQNIYGGWVPVGKGKVYHAYSRLAHTVPDLTYDPSREVYLCCDFNKTPMSWVICQIKRVGRDLPHHAVIGGKKITYQDVVIDVLDEIVIKESNTQEALNEYLARGYDKRLTVVYGDASGNRGTAKSDYAIFRENGFRDIRVPKANPAVIDRVASVNAKLVNAKGEIGIRISPKLKELSADFEQMSFKEGTRQLDKSDLKRSHTSDGFGYMVVRDFPAYMRKQKPMRYAGY